VLKCSPDFSNYSQTSCKVKYDLMALCLHIGDSPRAGHYMSVVKNIKDGIWRRYNDDNISVGTKQLDQTFLNHATPYICFYKIERLQLTNDTLTANNEADDSNIIDLNSSSESEKGK